MSLKSSAPMFDDHPLRPRLVAIFDDLNQPARSAQGIIDLKRLVDDEGDVLFHRDHVHNRQSTALHAWLTHSLKLLVSKPEHRLTAVEAMDVLMKVEYCEMSKRVELFYEQLTIALIETAATGKQQSSTQCIEVARVWGLVVEYGTGTGLLSAHVAQQLKECEEWLIMDKLVSRRHVACLMIRQMILKVSSLVFSRLPVLIDRELWSALRDPSPDTRASAAETLKSATLLLVTSVHPITDKVLESVFKTNHKTLQQKGKEVQHGALLALIHMLEALELVIPNSPGRLEVVAASVREMWKYCVTH